MLMVNVDSSYRSRLDKSVESPSIATTFINNVKTFFKKNIFGILSEKKNRK
jgi:hypothetical protein